MATSGQIQRSIQRFVDYANDLLRSDMNTFEDTLNVFLEFCVTDEVFSGIHAQLQSVPAANFDEWYTCRRETGGSMAGSCQLTFPTDPEIRMALMYELLRRIRDGRVGFHDFVLNFFAMGTNKITAYVQALNDAITRPLVRELGYRLQDISDQLPADRREVVSPATIQIIHQATNVIQQLASGSNITQTASQNLNPELFRLFDDLEKVISALETGKAEKEEYAEVISSAKELATAERPKIGTIKALFAALPPVASVLSITASILKLLGM